MRFTLLAGLIALTACSSDPDAVASAHVAATRGDLVGGQRALGEVGDIVMENDAIRVVIQGPEFSRGFGVYGGSLIDADLRRTDDFGDTLEGVGHDGFAELFPAFFFQATAVDEVKIIADGSDGGPAKVRASGTVGSFLEMLATFNRAAIGSHHNFLDGSTEQRIAYATTYEIAPGSRHVKLTFEVTNISQSHLEFPSAAGAGILGGLGIPTDGFTLPIGDVALYGKTNKVFLPGIGFNLRFGIDDAYKKSPGLPAFPGVVTDFIASRGEHISYGLMVDNIENSYVYNKRASYERPDQPITRSSLLVPFIASGFLGVFHAEAPALLRAGATFAVEKYFVLGTGDVGSLVDEMLEIRGDPAGAFGGQVFDDSTGHAATPDDAYVLVYQRLGADIQRIYSQYDVRPGGYFQGRLPPGKYSARAAGEGRPLGPLVDFEIQEDGDTAVQLVAATGATIVVTLVDEHGARVPGKASAVGTYGAEFSGQNPRDFLYDLAAGQHHMATDQIPDDPADPKTRRYLEAWGHAGGDGLTSLHVRPGTYTIVSSRGPEFGTVEEVVVVRAGQTVALAHAPARVIDSTGWIAADLHLHSVGSIDSGMSIDDRVVAVAAEGVEYAVSTDHNYVTDFAPAIERQGLSDWLQSSIGLEATTLESGHFNGYPLRYDIANVTHGSFDWPERPPDEIFAEIRALGRFGPEDTIVQVNHPRDTLLGYFQQYNRNGLTFDENALDFIGGFLAPQNAAFCRPDSPPRKCDTTFSFDFDAIELLNGKLFWQIRHYRVPDALPDGPLPDEIPPAGTILVNADTPPDVAFPGVIDDWFNLLNLGHRYLGTGTSDTHSGDDEAGYFRTMIHTGTDTPRQVTERAFVDGMRSGRIVATNGPLLDLWVNDEPMGSEVTDEDGRVAVRVRAQAADWVGLDRLNLYRNGVLVFTWPVEDPQAGFDETIEIPVASNDAGMADTWFVVEGIGYRNMFPVVRPNEVPPLQLSAALEAVAGPIGLGGGDYKSLQPEQIFPVTAYAITNPVWVKTTAGDWTPPGVVPVADLDSPDQPSGFPHHHEKSAERGPRAVRRIGRVEPLREVPEVLPFQRDRNNIYDIRHIFGAYAGHGH